MKISTFQRRTSQRSCLGVPTAFVDSYKFQHSGLPHGHNVETMRHVDNPFTTSDINSVIWAEIQNTKKYPKLYELVMQHMLHGLAVLELTQNV